MLPCADAVGLSVRKTSICCLLLHQLSPRRLAGLRPRLWRPCEGARGGWWPRPRRHRTGLGLREAAGPGGLRLPSSTAGQGWSSVWGVRDGEGHAGPCVYPGSAVLGAGTRLCAPRAAGRPRGRARPPVSAGPSAGFIFPQRRAPLSPLLATPPKNNKRRQAL